MAITFDLASNAVVNDGQTASFEVSNIQGVPVSGCPIGKAFYEGGTTEYPFVPSDWVGAPVIDGQELKVISLTDSYSFTDTPDKISFSLRSESGGYCSLYLGDSGAGELFKLGWMFAPGSLAVAYRVGGVYTTFGTVTDTSGVLIEGSVVFNAGSIDIDAKVSSVATPTEFFEIKQNVIADLSLVRKVSCRRGGGQNGWFSLLNVVGTNLPNNCTGEVPDATIEYYRNGLLDHTGNPWSFPADGNMDGDSIVARVIGGVDVTDSDPVIMSVLHYTSQPPSPQNLTEGDPLSLTWDIAGVTGEAVGCPIDKKFYKGGNLEYPFVDADFTTTPTLTAEGWAVNTSLTFETQSATGGLQKIQSKLSVTNGGFWDSSADSVRLYIGGSTSIFSFDISGRSTYMLLQPGVGTSFTAFTVSEWIGVEVSCVIDIEIINGFAVGSVTMSGGGVTHVISVNSPNDISAVTGVLSLAWVNAGVVDGVVWKDTYIVGDNLPNNCTGLSYPTDYTVNKNGVPLVTDSTTDTTISYSIPSVALGDAGDYDLTITNGGRDPFQSDIVSLIVKDAAVYVAVVRDIPQGDPKMFFSPDGMSLRFENGLPVMEQGLENYSAITLGTEAGFSGYRIARNGSEVVDNSFLKESRKSITKNQIRIIEDATKKSYQGAIADGLLKSVSAEVRFAAQSGYVLRVVLTPPTGEDRILVYNRNGENWIQQRDR